MQRRMVGQAVVRTHAEGFRAPLYKREGVPVAQNDAFRITRGAGGVEQIRRIALYAGRRSPTAGVELFCRSPVVGRDLEPFRLLLRLALIVSQHDELQRFQLGKEFLELG